MIMERGGRFSAVITAMMDYGAETSEQRAGRDRQPRIRVDWNSSRGPLINYDPPTPTPVHTPDAESTFPSSRAFKNRKQPFEASKEISPPLIEVFVYEIKRPLKLETIQ